MIALHLTSDLIAHQPKHNFCISLLAFHNLVTFVSSATFFCAFMYTLCHVLSGSVLGIPVASVAQKLKIAITFFQILTNMPYAIQGKRQGYLVHDDACFCYGDHVFEHRDQFAPSFFACLCVDGCVVFSPVPQRLCAFHQLVLVHEL